MSVIPDHLRAFNLGGKAIEFSTADGIVVSNQKWSEAHTYSSGMGGGYNSSTGQLELPEIKSYSVENQEVWLRVEKTGKDVQCRYAGKTIPITSGQKVSVVTMTIKGYAGLNVALVNHSTDRWHSIVDLEWLVGKQFFRRPSLLRTFALTAGGWCLLGLVVAGIAAAASQLMPTISQAQVKTFINMLLDILPTVPGVHSRRESIEAYTLFTVFSLILLPPIYSIWRHFRGHLRFTRAVGNLTARLNRLAQSLL